MPKSPLFSIIIPIYNTGDYLVQCIESILSQSFKDFELLLVDDGSTDNSLFIEQEFAQKDNRISLYQSNSGSVSSARNMGIRNAKGEYLLFIDSDDYLLSDALLQFNKALQDYGRLDFIQAPFAVLSEGKITPRSSRFNNLDEYTNQVWEECDYLIKMTFDIGYPWNSIIKRDFLIKHNILFHQEIGFQEDLLFIIEIFINGARGLLLETPTYVYRFGRPGSLTSSNIKLTDQEIAKRKRLLRSLIFCSKHLTQYLQSVSDFKLRKLLKVRITDNLTGVIGGSTILHPDKEIFNLLTSEFKRIPIAGGIGRKALACLYNLNHQLAFWIRKRLIKNYE